MEEEPEETHEEEAPLEEAHEEPSFHEMEEEAPPLEEEEAPAPDGEPLVPPNSVPVTLKVELGKIELGADKLLSLSPGNLLELGTHPTSPVDLVVSGRRVGRGELMMMGDTLGIRIIELGK